VSKISLVMATPSAARRARYPPFYGRRREVRPQFAGIVLIREISLRLVKKKASGAR
jgi:hypothetical protein